MKALKIIGAVLGLLIVAVGVTFAVGIPGGFITGTIEDRVEKETGYQLDINGGATIKLWPLTVVTLSDVVAVRSEGQGHFRAVSRRQHPRRTVAARSPDRQSARARDQHRPSGRQPADGAGTDPATDDRPEEHGNARRCAACDRPGRGIRRHRRIPRPAQSGGEPTREHQRHGDRSTGTQDRHHRRCPRRRSGAQDRSQGHPSHRTGGRHDPAGRFQGRRPRHAAAGAVPATAR